MECLERYTFVVMTSVILSGGVKMRAEHGVLRVVYIFCHDFCHTFRWNENECRAWHAREVYISHPADASSRLGSILLPLVVYTFRWSENECRAWNA